VLVAQINQFRGSRNKPPVGLPGDLTDSLHSVTEIRSRCTARGVFIVGRRVIDIVISSTGSKTERQLAQRPTVRGSGRRGAGYQVGFRKPTSGWI